MGEDRVRKVSINEEVSNLVEHVSIGLKQERLYQELLVRLSSIRILFVSLQLTGICHAVLGVSPERAVTEQCEVARLNEELVPLLFLNFLYCRLGIEAI